jgi:hypothetical protein
VSEKEFDMPFLRKICIHRLVTAAAVALSSWLVSPVQAVEPNDDILGTWKLTKVLDSSEISSLDDKDAARLVGKNLVIRIDKVTLAGETCEDPEFERHYEDTAKYLREEAHAAAGRLGLPEVVTVVDLACTEALLKGYNKIVVYWKGFFFDAVKQPPGELSAKK